jgi:hypothetical protein
MKPAHTFTSAVIAVGVVAFIGTSASACEYQKQVLAKAQNPPAEEQTVTSATPIDPVLLAEMRSKETETAVEK